MHVSRSCSNEDIRDPSVVNAPMSNPDALLAVLYPGERSFFVEQPTAIRL